MITILKTKPTLIAIILMAFIMLLMLLLSGYYVRAELIPSFTITTTIDEVTGFAVSNQSIYATDTNSKIEKQYDYNSCEITAYEFEGDIAVFKTYENNDYIFETKKWYGDNKVNTIFNLWHIDPITGKEEIGGLNYGGASYAEIIDEKVYLTGQHEEHHESDYFKCFTLSPWEEVYSAEISDAGDILIDGSNAYVQDNRATREIIILDSGASVPGGTWVDPIHVFRKDSGTWLKTFEVKGSVSGMFKYGDYLVFTHNMVFHLGYSTITVVETTSGEYTIEDEYQYEPYGITQAIMVDDKIIGTLSHQADETPQGYSYASRIIVFDLETRTAEYRDLNHEGIGIEYDPINEYILVGVPYSGIIHVYTLDSILNG